MNSCTACMICILQPNTKIPTQKTSELPVEPPLSDPLKVFSGTTSAPSGATSAPSGATSAPSGATSAPSGATSAPPAGGSSIPGPCQECYCGPKMDPITKLNIIICKPIVCNKNCSEVSSIAGHTNKYTHTHTHTHTHTQILNSHIQAFLLQWPTSFNLHLTFIT